MEPPEPMMARMRHPAARGIRLSPQRTRAACGRPEANGNRTRHPNADSPGEGLSGEYVVVRYSARMPRPDRSGRLQAGTVQPGILQKENSDEHYRQARGAIRVSAAALGRT